MKVLHSTLMKHYSPGIVFQMYCEYKAAKKNGINYDVKIFMPEQSVPEEYKEIIYFVKNKHAKGFRGWLELRRNYYSWLYSQKKIVDVYVLRYLTHDPLQFFFIKKNPKKTYLVHHTLELAEIRMNNSVRGYIKYVIEKYWGAKSIKASYGTVGVTEEIVDYERSRGSCNNKLGIVYPNGIEVGQGEILDQRNSDIPEILFVASYFYDWHGLDLLINTVRSSNQNFYIHIVGNVSDIDLNNLKQDKRFIIHNSLTSKEIEKLSAKCWISLGSFALDRKNLKEGSTLKVREYLNNGLPVYSGHKDIFPKDFIFYENSNLCISKILDFAYEMKKYNKNTVRDFSEKYISKKVLVNNFYKKLNKEFN